MKYYIFENKTRSPYWYVSFTSPDGKRKQISTGLLISQFTRAQVEAHLNAKTKTDKNIQHGNLQWFKEYILNRIKHENLAPKTIENYEFCLDCLIEFYGPEYDLKNIKRGNIWEFQNYLMSKSRKTKTGLFFPAKPTTVNIITRTIQAAFNRLYEAEIITVNPFIRHKKISVTDERTPLTQDELLRFIEAVEKESFLEVTKLIKILVFTGIRRGEVLLISRSDVDMENMQFYTTNTKDHSDAKRWIAIPEIVREEFNYFLKQYPLRDFPFAICKPDWLTHKTKKFMRASNLDWHRLHDLRHTFITLALESGSITIENLRDYIGHADLKTTMHYRKKLQASHAPDLGLNLPK